MLKTKKSYRLIKEKFTSHYFSNQSESTNGLGGNAKEDGL